MIAPIPLVLPEVASQSLHCIACRAATPGDAWLFYCRTDNTTPAGDDTPPMLA
jgi:hypothetical protein